MLNRRTLRVKAMQALFAFYQSKESNYFIGKQNIDKAFAPDLNSMDVQDHVLLAKRAEESKKLYDEHYKQKEILAALSEDESINRVTVDTIHNYHDNVAKDKRNFQRQMINEAEKIVTRYILVLQLIVEFSNLAELDKKIKRTNLVKNQLVKALKESKAIESILLKFNLSWRGLQDEVKSWYKELVRKDEKIIAYLDQAETTFEDDSEIIQHLVKLIFKSNLVASYMEEEDINWGEDKAIIRSMVLKTLKNITEETLENFELVELSYNWEDDKAFFIKLYNETIDLEKEYKSMIAQRTKNWDIDRLAAVDRIALEMGVAEMLHFPSIPIKVTINEYIELAKNYSTPKSKQFINGILDTISKDLINEGKVKKSGRGLIDNR